MAVQSRQIVLHFYSSSRSVFPSLTFSRNCNAYRALGVPAESQLANFHRPQWYAPATLINPHLIGAGIGGHDAQDPSSYVVSKFSKKNGTTSVYPAFVIVFLPQARKIAAALTAPGLDGFGAVGRLAKDAIVAISL
jgi:hypothetical protein